MKPIETSTAAPLRIPNETLAYIKQLIKTAMKSRASECDLNYCIKTLKEQLEETKRKTEHADSQVFDFINQLEHMPVRDLMALYCLGSGSAPNFNEARIEMASTDLDLRSIFMADKVGFVPSLRKGINKHTVHSLVEALRPRSRRPFTHSTSDLDFTK